MRHNVLLAGEVFYFGFVARLFRKKYCNKIKQISTENYIAIFLLAATFCELQILAKLQSTQNKTFRLLAVSSCARNGIIIGIDLYAYCY